MHFETPLIFMLLPLPWFIYRFWPSTSSDTAALYMPGIAHFSQVQNEAHHPPSSKLNIVLLSMAWLALLISSANPIRLGEAVELPASGRDLLLAVDISGSMDFNDMIYQGRRSSRLTAVKAVLKDFLERRQGDRVGLILYGSGAYIQAPLTFDLNTVEQLLLEAEIGFAGDGTAIGDAIGLSIKRLANNPADSRVVILLTDGQNSAGVVDPIEAAKIAKQEQVKVYTVGVGHPQSRRYPIDEISLQKIAVITEGQYFRARSTQELEEIYQVIDQLETLEQEPETFRPKQSLFYWPLAFSLACIMVLLIEKKTRLSQRFTATGDSVVD